MTRFMTVVLLSVLATGMSAGQSDRYHDMRLDTSKPTLRPDIPRTATPRPEAARTPPPAPQPATRARTYAPRPATAPGYAYANPYGVGPDNDSR